MTEISSIFKIDLNHDYYGDQAPPIHIIPDAATNSIISNNQLRLRSTRGGLNCFGPSELISPLNSAEPWNFTFRLMPEDPSIFSVTEYLANQRAYFYMNLVPGEEIVTKRRLEKNDRRNLEISDIETDELRHNDLLNPPLAILQLGFNSALKERVFKLQFGTVKYYRVYHVISQGADMAFSIKDQMQEVSFVATKPPENFPGKYIQSFRSTESISMFARALGRFDLWRDDGLAGKPLIAELPEGGASSISLNGSDLYSEVYVYV